MQTDLNRENADFLPWKKKQELLFCAGEGELD